MADWAKIAIKIALIGGFFALLVAITASISVPNFDLTTVWNAVGFGSALIYHWTGGMSNILVNMFIITITLRLGVALLRWAVLAERALIKANE